MIEENGGNISEGQKQLICIARIILTKPPMLILDEATSFIDTRTELQIQKALDAMMEGRTTFIVAHRLSTIENADTILVMDKGKILEQGNHQDLLAKKVIIICCITVNLILIVSINKTVAKRYCFIYD